MGQVKKSDSSILQIQDIVRILTYYCILIYFLTIILTNCLLAAIMYVLLPMPLLFFAGSDTSSLFTESSSGLGFFP